MSVRPRYGSNGVRGRAAYGQPAPEPVRLSWRDVRPVLLKSAGIVGLAGAIMAVVSSNALFVDPGGPDRPSLRPTLLDNGETAAVVIAATPAAVLGDEVMGPPLHPAVTAEVLPPAEAEQPETTASVIPAEPRFTMAATGPEPIQPVVRAAASEPEIAPVAETELAAPEKDVAVAYAPTAAEPDAVLPPAPVSPSVEPIATTILDPAEQTATEPTPAVTVEPVAVAPTTVPPAPAPPSSVSPPAALAANAPAAVPAPEIRKDEPADAEIAVAAADLIAEEDRERVVGASALWPEDSVECPRDWVASQAEEGAAQPSACKTIAALVEPAESDTLTLRKALPDDVLDFAALAPPIPLPDPNAEAEPKPVKKQKPTRTARRSDWPAAPPPDCGNLHAYWRFTDRKAGTKEWYCR